MNPNGSLLIVDDENDITQQLKDVLSDSVQEIEIASNGLEALEKIRKHKFDAILSDLNMPKMDGLKLLKQLREENFLTPFVILTGLADKNSAVQALKLNAFDYLEKPWHSDELIEVVSRAIELGQQYNEWTSDPDLISGLKGIQMENILEAMYRMKNSNSRKS